MIPVADQQDKLQGSFLMAGYGVTWLGQNLPPFTSNSFALAPFKNWQGLDESLPTGQNETLTAPTTMYQTSLECSPPVNISFRTNEGLGASAAFDDGKGCATNFLIDFPNSLMRNNSASATWSPYYVGYWTDAIQSTSLDYAGCPESYRHTFLAIWAPNTNSAPNFKNDSEASALFCTTSYHIQEVNATIALADLSVVSTVPLAAKKVLSEELFNATNFESILAVGHPRSASRRGYAQKDPDYFADVSDTMMIFQETRLREMKVVVPANNMIGYAVGLYDGDLGKLTKPEELHRAFESAHQLLFALAVQDLIPSDDSFSTASGMFHTTLQAVRLVHIFAIITQVLLLFVLLFTCYLLWSYPRRRNSLTSDPNSLAEVMSMADDQGIQQLLCRSNVDTADGLARLVTSKRFYIGSAEPELKSQLHILDEKVSSPLPADTIPNSTNGNAGPKVVRPPEYSWFLGIPLIVFLMALIVSLCILRQKGLIENGMCSQAGC
jgi:hypothetical protein